VVTLTGWLVIGPSTVKVALELLVEPATLATTTE